MNRQRGFTLIEVMVAAAVLGLAATALFGLLSKSLTNLRKIEDLHHYQLAGDEMMNRVLLLPILPPDGIAEGSIEKLKARWRVTIAPWYPAKLDDHPGDAVMKVNVEVVWPGQSGDRHVQLETIKGTAVTYDKSYDLQKAIETIVAN
jgi:general secretion pathway protein I